MSIMCRRQFLSQMGVTGTTFATASSKGSGQVQTGASKRARVIADPARPVATLDRRLFGSFVEHIGRCIYGGIYEPGSKLAGPDGFRKDILAEVRQLGVPIIRYPGGNFVSGYNWLDGVGPPKPTSQDGKLQDMDAQDIEFYNSLQVLQSHRQIYSRDPEFQLAVRLCKPEA